MLLTVFNAGCPPVAAMYCCTIYLAVEASYNNQLSHIQNFIWYEIKKKKNKIKKVLQLKRV